MDSRRRRRAQPRGQGGRHGRSNEAAAPHAFHQRAGHASFRSVLLLDREAIAGLLGLASRIPVAVAGAICVGFAPVLFLAARKRDLSAREAELLVAVDGAWVAASLLVATLAPITALGRVLVAAQAALVAIFMILEVAGISRLQAQTA
jgi:hypothetical protein